jgi:hypothetical protein
VTHLRKIMLEELQRRHYSEATTHYYIRPCRKVRTTFQLLSGSFRSTTHSRVPSSPVHQAEVIARCGDEPSLCLAVFLACRRFSVRKK